MTCAMAAALDARRGRGAAPCYARLTPVRPGCREEAAMFTRTAALDACTSK